MDPAAIEQLPMPVTYGRHLARLFDPEALLGGTGIQPADLDDPALRITVRQALRYVENAITLAAQPDWYFTWVAGLSDHFHGPMSLAMSSAPSLGDVIDAFTRYFPSRIPYLHMQRRTDDEHVLVELLPLIDLGTATPLLVETPLLILIRHLETVYDVNFTQTTVELAHPPTPYADRYVDHFRCDVRFDAPHNALRIPAAWCTLANLGYIESSWAHALSQCEAMMGSSRERETLGDIRALLCVAFERSDRERPLPKLSEVADALHVTPRTLIRRLRRLGTTYQQITDDFLLARAHEMLENDELAIKQVAANLGFDNPANFGKAFRRWCGMSPGSYRKRQVRSDRS
ncbi:MAG: AraC family transcriptional regulator [Gammaproteobacteria bacterium]|jgi:AraC-like DNA-binding protein